MTNKPLINKKHIQYLEGTLPIIISVPHGGTDSPDNISNRTNGIFEADEYTKELTFDIINEFFIQTNSYPHTIIMDLARIKVDANREEKEAVSCHNSLASYKTFHNFIKESIDTVEQKQQKGLYIDIHGRSHSHEAIEVGYLLTNDILRLEKNDLSLYKDKSSIKTLSNYSKFSFVEQLKEEYSLGTLMTKNGFKSIPSKEIPFSSNDEEYFEGAYNTKVYSSINDSCVSSIQIEFPYYCRKTQENRKKTAKALVKSILEFMKIHFNLDIKSS